jgi:hypothetical protein
MGPLTKLLSSFRGARSASFDVQLHIRESILTIVVMDSGPAPSGASRNDGGAMLQMPPSYPAKAGYPVRRGLSIQSPLPLEYWIRLRSLSYGGQVTRPIALNMCPRSRGAMRPRFAGPLSLLEREGAGKTGCALHPRSRAQDAQAKTHTSIQVQRKQSGLPCAMVLRLISSSPR